MQWKGGCFETSDAHGAAVRFVIACKYGHPEAKGDGMVDSGGAFPTVRRKRTRQVVPYHKFVWRLICMWKNAL